MRRALKSAILAAALATPARAADPALPDFTAPESDARILGLAGTGTAVAAGAGAVWWNPAGLAAGPSSELLLAHVALRSHLAHQSGVFALRPIPGRALWFAVQADVLRESGIPVSEVAPGLVPTPPEAGYRAALHLAGDLGRGIALGAAVGRMRGLAGMPDPGPRTVGDAGVLWRHAGTRAGLAMRGAALDGGSRRTPCLSAGLAQWFAASRVLGGLQLDRDADGALHPASGLEWRALPGLVLRAGARWGDREQGTSGTGGLQLSHDRLRLDYALRAERGESAVHALTLGFDLGSEPPPPAVLPASAKPPATPAPSPAAPRRAAEDTSPRAPRPAPESRAPAPPPQPEKLCVVRAGPFPTLETAAEAMQRLRRVDLRPTVFEKGEDYFVVVAGGVTRAEAERIQALARRAGVRSALVPE